MARIGSSTASLQVIGDDMDPDEVSALLGAQPTWARRNGEPIRRPPPGTAITHKGVRLLRAAGRRPADLDARAAEPLGALAPDLSAWRALGARLSLDLFCGLVMADTNEGEPIAPRTLFALGERGVALGLDIYAPLHGDPGA